jgi:hypothetical protein
MGRPIKKKFIKSTQPHHIVCDAWVGADNANRVSAIITSQKASNEYRVDSSGVGGPALTPTNGSSKGYLCKLVNGIPAAAGQMSIAVDPYVAPTGAATFTVTMEVNTATLVTPGGTSVAYQPGDVLTVVGGTFTTAATITVNTVSAGGVATFTLTNHGSYTALPANPVSVTDSPTTTAAPSATFNLKYDVLSVAVGGTNTGYGANTELVFDGGGYTTQATATTVVTSGHVGTPTMVNHGAGYTSIPTVTALSFGPTQYARKINNRTVETFAGNRYKWELTGTELTGSGTPAGGTTEGTQVLGEAFIQSV